MTTDHTDTPTEHAAKHRTTPQARRRALLAAAIGLIGGTAALLLPATTSVAVSSYSTPTSETTETTLQSCAQEDDTWKVTWYQLTTPQQTAQWAFTLAKDCYNDGGGIIRTISTRTWTGTSGLPQPPTTCTNPRRPEPQHKKDMVVTGDVQKIDVLFSWLCDGPGALGLQWSSLTVA